MAGIIISLIATKKLDNASSGEIKPLTENQNQSNNSSTPNAYPHQSTNDLVNSAKGDLDEVEKIQDANEDRVDKINKAENANDADEVRKQLNEAIEAIDKGLVYGDSATDKIERASQIETEPIYKEYLSFKAQGFRKQVEAFRKLREAAVIERDNFGTGGDVEKKAMADFRKAYNDYKKLLTEAKDPHRKADEIARKSPDKIKDTPSVPERNYERK